MKQSYPEYWPQYFTATIYEWQHLLSDKRHKEIIIKSLQFLVAKKRILLHAFVIMSNHLHLIWQPMYGFTPSDIQASFMRHTARELKQSLILYNGDQLEQFKVNKYDRMYQIWKREPLSIELFTQGVFFQKMEYIHWNPVKADLCAYPEEYQYSSARFYHDGTDRFHMLTHYSGN